MVSFIKYTSRTTRTPRLKSDILLTGTWFVTTGKIKKLLPAARAVQELVEVVRSDSRARQLRVCQMPVHSGFRRECDHRNHHHTFLICHHHGTAS